MKLKLSLACPNFRYKLYFNPASITYVAIFFPIIGHKKVVFSAKTSTIYRTATDIFAKIPQKGMVRAQCMLYLYVAWFVFIVIGGFCFKV